LEHATDYATIDNRIGVDDCKITGKEKLPLQAGSGAKRPVATGHPGGAGVSVENGSQCRRRFEL
jgi:hypothetical protein